MLLAWFSVLQCMPALSCVCTIQCCLKSVEINFARRSQGHLMDLSNQDYDFEKKKIVTKAIDLSTFHCGLFLNIWLITCVSYISLQVVTGSQSILVAAFSRFSLWYLPIQHPGCEVSIISQGRRTGSEIISFFFIAYIEHLKYPKPSHKLHIWPKSTHYLILFSNINCLSRLP